MKGNCTECINKSKCKKASERILGSCETDFTPINFAEYLKSSKELELGDCIVVYLLGGLIRSSHASKTEENVYFAISMEAQILGYMDSNVSERYSTVYRVVDNPDATCTNDRK